MNPPKFEKCVDMANLTYLNEAAILYNLRARYAKMMIYVSRAMFVLVEVECKLDLYPYKLYCI